MGRYLFFNTGLEYKMAFGVQHDTDIEFYGGQWMLNEEDGTFNRVWAETDIAIVNQRLLELEQAYLLDRPNLSLYKKTDDGTYTLKHDFWAKHKYHMIDELKARYLLGLLIYHQLSYQCPLIARTDF